MIDRELLQIAMRNIRTQKLRSYLTLLGIIIGIAAIVALVSIGEGLNQAVNQEFEKLGLDTIMVEPGSGSFVSTAVSRTLKESDERLIEGTPGVEAAMGFYETAAVAKFKDKGASIFIFGFDPAKISYLEEVGYIDLVDGRKLESGDKYSIIIGESFAANGFLDETLNVKDQLEINGQKFKVIGITKDSSFGMGFGFNNMIFTNKETVRDFFGEKNPSEIVVKATDRTIVDDVAEKIKQRLKRAHGEEDFYVMTTENIMQSAGVVINLIQLVLIGLAAISLLVGGIGIMNTMLMAVMERTQEIGVMKAVGATNTKVLSLFLAEAALIGGIGGSIGIVFGLLIGAGVSIVATALGFPLTIGINIFSIIGALLFAMAVGMGSGYYPARRAARMEPIEALRYGK